jgi:magnesium-transporting ATPase (P-type)
VAADQKLAIVEALQRKRQVVAVTGDGVNDAPALKAADIGIAMGESGTEVARGVAGVVLLRDNFANIVAGIEEGRAIYANIRRFLAYVLSSNVPELVPYLAMVLFRVPLALTVIQILAVDLGTDMLPAMALGAQPPEPGLMRQPPRSRHRRLFDVPLLLWAYGFLGAMEAVAGMAAFFYARSSTACLTAIVVMQVANVLICRRSGLAGMRLIVGAIAVELGLILSIDYTRAGNWLIGTSPIGVDVWLFIVPFALFMIATEWCRRALFSLPAWRRLLGTFSPPAGR